MYNIGIAIGKKCKEEFAKDSCSCVLGDEEHLDEFDQVLDSFEII